MGFKFTFLCDLLSNLDDNRHLRASTASRASNPDFRIISQWFSRYGKRIHDGKTDRLALLSCIFPEKRTDRVYWLKDTSLSKIIGRCLLLGSSRRAELERWRVPGGGDLGHCVENVMRQTENDVRAGDEVTVEEIDALLNSIASSCRFSGPPVRGNYAAVDVESALSPLYRRLSSRDAKWLTRMILKSYAPVVLPVDFILKSFHFLLPHLLLFQDSFEAALDMLSREPMRHFPAHPEPGLAKDLGAIAAQHLKPRVGIKIGRPEYYKARSIKHCCQMVGRRRISLERKYDGEYCQVHVDLRSSASSIRIFSKSGKDSTRDRAGIHATIRQSLRMGMQDCRISQCCVLEGELVVWSDARQKILDFHKLRKFISRSGAFIGADNDSPPQPDEHLMIVFFDILLLDDDVLLSKPHRERRLLLKKVVQSIPGRAALAEQEVIDFSHPDSVARLERAVSRSMAERWEGYVLKGSDEPYFSIRCGRGTGLSGRWIKLKKDYIPGLGDTVDLALVGGRFRSQDLKALTGLDMVLWTHFYVGCLLNRDSVNQIDAMPKIRLIDMVDSRCMSREHMQFFNQFGQFSACNIDSNRSFRLEYGHAGLPPMDVVFKRPFVVEMMGYGFEKPANARYFTLRFPRILKVHCDRDLADAASFSELQLLAEQARSVPSDELTHETENWAKRLKITKGAHQYTVDISQGTETSVSSVAGSSEPGQAPGELRSPEQAASCACNSQKIIRRSAKDGSQVVARGFEPRVQDPTSGTIVIYQDGDPLFLSALQRYGTDGRSLAQVGSHASNILSRGYVRPAGTCSLETTTRLTAKGIDQDGSVPCTENETATKRPVLPVAADLSSEPLAPVPNPLEQSKEITSIPYTPQPAVGRSPLQTIPTFFASRDLLVEAPCDEINARLQQMTLAPSLEKLLGMLHSEDQLTRMRQSNPHAASKGLALGLILVGPDLCSLGTELSRIGRTLFDTLSRKTPRLALTGMLFFLDARVIQLGKGVDDMRFCLRETWKKLGRTHFLGSIVWDARAIVGKTASSGRWGRAESRPQNHSRQSDGNEQARPWLSVRFDRRDLEVLGEFASVEPLIHVSGKWIDEL